MEIERRVDEEPSMEEAFRIFCRRLEEVTEELNLEFKGLKDESLENYTRAEDLQKTLTLTKDTCHLYTSTVTQTLQQMSALRKALNQITETLEQKLTAEGARAWILTAEPADIDYAKLAEQKAIVMQEAQARSTVAKARAESLTALERSAALEREAAETYTESVKAAEEAEAAKKRTEEALRAAELKAKADREAKRKEEEQRRRQEMEERKAKEEEERRKREDAKRNLSPEEEEARRREAERVNPKNWPMAVFSVEPGDLDIPVGCVVRSLPGTFRRDQLEVEAMSQLEGVITLEENEELVSHILDFIPADGHTSLKLEEPLAIAIPHCAPRVPSREVIVKKKLPNGQWTEIESYDVSIDDIKEFRFVEVRLRELAPLVVVTRFKKETLTFTRRGGKLSPSVEPRIVLTARPATVRMATDVTFEVQPVELMAVSDVKQRQGELCEGLLSSSPILNLLVPVRRFIKPITYSLPVPPPPGKAKRPQTAAPTPTKSSTDKEHKSHKPHNRPSSALFGPLKKEEEIEDKLHLLVFDQTGQVWSRRPDVSFTQSKNKDLITFETEEVLKRMLVLRTKMDVTDSEVEAIASALYRSLSQRAVHVLLRQFSDDPTEVTLHIVNLNSSERFQRKLTEDGYGIGPNPSHEVLLLEGEKLNVQFWGNIKETYDARLRCVYNSHIKTKLDFTVVEIDKFAQKAISCYRGMVQVFTTRRKKVKQESNKQQNMNIPGEPQVEEAMWTEEQVLLDEMLVNLPKAESEMPKPLEKAPVSIKGEGMVNDRLLRHLSLEIGDEWRRLARYLKIRSVRIQAILRNNVNSDQENAIYDMLMTWAKKLPCSCNKVDVLCQALSHVGRIDLVEELRDREHDYREDRAQYHRDSLMKKAFVKVAQNVHVTNDWKFLGHQMGVPANDLTAIERDYNGQRERCLQSLIRWRELQGGHATMDTLLKHLRQCRYTHVIAQIKSLGL